MKEGDAIKGLVGWEWHGYPLLDLPGMEVLTHGETKAGRAPGTPHEATIYDGPKGNVVFTPGPSGGRKVCHRPQGHVLPPTRPLSRKVWIRACSA